MASSCSDPLCDSCGLPPRHSADETPIALKRCSRCKKTWYHDIECQRRHFRAHRKVCFAQMDTTTPPTDAVQKEPMFRRESRPRRGQCLVACRSIDAGQVLSFFSPLFPPVLNEANRRTRCALCFGLLNEDSMMKYSDYSEHFPVLTCSYQCYQQGLPWLEEEVRLVKDFIDGKITILQTAVLLYRVLRNIAAQESSTEYEPATLLRNQVENLQAHETNMSDNERNHTRVVISLAKRLIHGRAQLVKEREQIILSSFSVDYMTKTISRMKTNGFSVCNGESIAMGVGIFAEASNMNHSCRPNALQTFSYARPGVVPTIRITACTTISSGDEICISYIDNGCPRDIRRKRLQEGYHFWCTCSFCLDDSHDDYIIGMHCPKTGCHGMGQRTSHLDSKPEYKCKCGNVDFLKGTELMKAFHSNDRTKMSYKERENLYTAFRLSFFASSWYVCESGEELAQSLLDGIHGCDEHKSRRLCARALSVLNEVLAASASDNDAGKVLRNHVLLYKIAKLRLFLYPDPRVALTELQRTKKVLSRYYPDDHEFLQGLENTVSQAMH